MNSLTRSEQIWKHSFSSLVDCDDQYINQLTKQSKVIDASAKQRILVPGVGCTDYLLLAEGRLRVQFITESGREVVLYHVNPGDDCILTTSCLFSGNSFPRRRYYRNRCGCNSHPRTCFSRDVRAVSGFSKVCIFYFQQTTY